MYTVFKENRGPLMKCGITFLVLISFKWFFAYIKQDLFATWPSNLIMVNTSEAAYILESPRVSQRSQYGNQTPS